MVNLGWTWAIFKLGIPGPQRALVGTRSCAGLTCKSVPNVFEYISKFSFSVELVMSSDILSKTSRKCSNSLSAFDEN